MCLRRNLVKKSVLYTIILYNSFIAFDDHLKFYSTGIYKVIIQQFTINYNSLINRILQHLYQPFSY